MTWSRLKAWYPPNLTEGEESYIESEEFAVNIFNVRIAHVSTVRRSVLVV